MDRPLPPIGLPLSYGRDADGPQLRNSCQIEMPVAHIGRGVRVCLGSWFESSQFVCSSY